MIYIERELFQVRQRTTGICLLHRFPLALHKLFMNTQRGVFIEDKQATFQTGIILSYHRIDGDIGHYGGIGIATTPRMQMHKGIALLPAEGVSDINHNGTGALIGVERLAGTYERKILKNTIGADIGNGMKFFRAGILYDGIAPGNGGPREIHTSLSQHLNQRKIGNALKTQHEIATVFITDGSLELKAVTGFLPKIM